MGHALNEALRVVVPRGTIIDLRPYTLENPIEILSKDRIESAGIADLSLNRALDLSADHAFEIAVKDGKLTVTRSEMFDVAYYWKSVDEMFAEFEDKWKDDIRVPGGVKAKAFELFNQHQGKARLRLQMPMKLVVYNKVS